MPLLGDLYQACFEQIAGVVPSLHFASLGWSNAEGKQLSLVLAKFTNLTALDVGHNQIEGRGAQALAAAVLAHPTIETFEPLDLKALRDDKVSTLDLERKDMGTLEALVLAGVLRGGCTNLTALNVRRLHAAAAASPSHLGRISPAPRRYLGRCRTTGCSTPARPS